MAPGAILNGHLCIDTSVFLGRIPGYHLQGTRSGKGIKQFRKVYQCGEVHSRFCGEPHLRTHSCVARPGSEPELRTSLQTWPVAAKDCPGGRLHVPTHEDFLAEQGMPRVPHPADPGFVRIMAPS